MDDKTILISIISGLLVIVQVLVAYIFRNAVADLKDAAAELKERINRVDARFEQYTKEKERFDYQFRHDELSPRLVEIVSRIGVLERFPSRVDILWSKIFNGSGPK